MDADYLVHLGHQVVNSHYIKLLSTVLGYI